MFNIFKIFSKKPKELPLTSREQLAMFGVWQSPSGPRLVMEKQETGRKSCKKCKGYGTYGNPLCGALYACSECKGTGKEND